LKSFSDSFREISRHYKSFQFSLFQKSVKGHHREANVLRFKFRIWLIYVLRLHFQTAVTSKQMIGKGFSWSHSLHLIKLFPDLTNFLKNKFSELV
jgi:hypothetical protein